MSNINATKVLSGLKAEGVTIGVRSLAKYMASNCVLVTPHIGRARGYIPMTDSAYGIDLSNFTEEGGAFYQTRVSQSHLNFIPPEDEAELATIEKRLRRAVELRSLTDGFMPMSAYDDLREEFLKNRSDYFNKRDEIVQKWSALTTDFEFGLDEMLKGVQIPQTAREELKKRFLSQVPSIREYQSSFSMTLHVRAFPAEEAAIPEGLSSSIAADIKSTWSDEVVQTALLSIENLIGQGWSRLVAAMRQYEKGASIRNSSIVQIEKFGSDLLWKNVFKNPILARLSSELKGISSMNEDDQADIMEGAIGYIYAYAKDVRINLDMKKCPYDQAQLDAMSYVAFSQAKKGA